MGIWRPSQVGQALNRILTCPPKLRVRRLSGPQSKHSQCFPLVSTLACAPRVPLDPQLREDWEWRRGEVRIVSAVRCELKAGVLRDGLGEEE